MHDRAPGSRRSAPFFERRNRLGPAELGFSPGRLPNPPTARFGREPGLRFGTVAAMRAAGEIA